MIAMHAAAMDVIHAGPAGMGEMPAVIAVQGAIAVLVPEGAIGAPIAVPNGP